MRLDPAVARARNSVRAHLGSAPILVALSGGTDSLALAATVAFEKASAQRKRQRAADSSEGRDGVETPLRAGAVIIDHALQPGSEQVAEQAANTARRLGLDPVVSHRVLVENTGDGPEADARAARYCALERYARETFPGETAQVWTAHTRDDQAEQVLLGLARGSGLRSLAGIPPLRGVFVRPFLDISRRETRAICQAEGLEAWEDPQNSDERFTRVRVRKQLLPVLEAQLGTQVRDSLARTARLARQDADALDALAATSLQRAMACVPGPAEADLTLNAEALRELPAALLSRVIRQAAWQVAHAHLTHQQTNTATELLTNWHGQGELNFSGVSMWRTRQHLHVRRFVGSPRQIDDQK
jgi:tRNA(Ile)-lysidine synthase